MAIDSLLQRYADRAGVTLKEYKEKRAAGIHFCNKCRRWKSRLDFYNRAAGWDPLCKICRAARSKKSPYSWIADKRLRKSLPNALRKLNTQICSVKLQGLQAYFDARDVKTIFRQQQMTCPICYEGLSDAIVFYPQIPLSKSSVISVENILAIHQRCKRKLTRPRAPLRMRSFNYDGFSQAIVHLAEAVYNKDLPQIAYFKAEVDKQLISYVQTMQYVIDEPITPSLKPYTSLGEEIETLAERVKSLLESVHRSGEYIPRSISESTDRQRIQHSRRQLQGD